VTGKPGNRISTTFFNSKPAMRRLCYFQRMILYAPQPTTRVAYMAQWLGMRLFGHALQIISDSKSLPQSEPVINYSHEILSFKSYHIVPHGLLHQQGIQAQSIELNKEGSLPFFFASQEGHHAFDVLAAAFFLLQRYEEYYPEYELDEYSRYSHKNSLAWQQVFLKRPLVDEWVEDLKGKLSACFEDIRFAALNPSLLATCDVDIAWSYRNKGLLRNIGGFFNDIKNLHWGKLPERLVVLAGLKKDPFEILLELEEAHNYHHIPSCYFFLLAAQHKGHDKNISPRNNNLQRLIRWIQKDTAVGIHLSWAASQGTSLMQKEKRYMEKAIQQPVMRNRMHYLNFRIPETYRQLIEIGITADYSMGYGTINGFRASTSHPYYWYDIENEATTSLKIFPFAWMDANSIFEQKDSPAAAYAEWMQLYEPVKTTGGVFITICHNHLMGLDGEGRSWWLIYNRALKTCGYSNEEATEP
jgi:hypothetical protein